MAGEFWDTKPFTTWSDAELQQLLTDSPWARRITVGAPGAPAASGRGAAEAAAPIQALISWRSALPMKQALVRSQIGANGTVSAEAKALLDRRELAYVVSVDGLPSRLAGSTADIRVDTSIRAGAKPPIGPSEGLARPSGGNLSLAFVFPRSPIVLQDNDVEFLTRVGRYEIRRTFTLKDMVFRGQLEL
jgi:hypothetical protein